MAYMIGSFEPSFHLGRLESRDIFEPMRLLLLLEESVQRDVVGRIGRLRYRCCELHDTRWEDRLVKLVADSFAADHCHPYIGHCSLCIIGRADSDAHEGCGGHSRLAISIRRLEQEARLDIAIRIVPATCGCDHATACDRTTVHQHTRTMCPSS